jgi:hypothetical protein
MSKSLLVYVLAVKALIGIGHEKMPVRAKSEVEERQEYE